MEFLNVALSYSGVNWVEKVKKVTRAVGWLPFFSKRNTDGGNRTDKRAEEFGVASWSLVLALKQFASADKSWFICRVFTNQSKHTSWYIRNIQILRVGNQNWLLLLIRSHKIKLEMTEYLCHPTAAQRVLKLILKRWNDLRYWPERL